MGLRVWVKSTYYHTDLDSQRSETIHPLPPPLPPPSPLPPLSLSLSPSTAQSEARRRLLDIF
jgi:hypothetical protein